MKLFRIRENVAIPKLQYAIFPPNKPVWVPKIKESMYLNYPYIFYIFFLLTLPIHQFL